MRVLAILVMSGALGLLGCDTESSGSGGTAGTGGTGGMGGEGGMGGSVGLPSSGEFCDDFDGTCEYGVRENYGNRPDCLVSYEGYSSTRKGCVVEHLGFAADAEPGATRELHCGHASGAAPCGP